MREPWRVSWRCCSRRGNGRGGEGAVAWAHRRLTLQKPLARVVCPRVSAKLAHTYQICVREGPRGSQRAAICHAADASRCTEVKSSQGRCRCFCRPAPRPPSSERIIGDLRPVRGVSSREPRPPRLARRCRHRRCELLAAYRRKQWHPAACRTPSFAATLAKAACWHPTITARSADGSVRRPGCAGRASRSRARGSLSCPARCRARPPRPRPGRAPPGSVGCSPARCAWR